MAMIDLREEIVEEMESHRRYTAGRIADLVDVDQSVVRANIAALAAAGRVYRDGDRQASQPVWRLAGDADE